jgi:hypothetical protein
MSATQFSNGGMADISVMWQKLHAEQGQPYLITVMTGVQRTTDICFCSPYPQTRAVMDDFGDLMLVRGWL